MIFKNVINEDDKSVSSNLKMIKDGIKNIENASGKKSLQFLRAFDVAMYAIEIMSVLSDTETDSKIGTKKYKRILIDELQKQLDK